MRAKGFSLIELMIVIGVIAIINLVMYPNFSALHQTAKELSAKSSARSIMVALEQYYFVHYSYPNGNNQPIYKILATLKENNFLQSVPINPFTGNAYSQNDESGQLLYHRLDVDRYVIRGYDATNQTVLFEYP